MNPDQIKRPIEWAQRVNQRWIVRYGLGLRAEEWLAYLAASDPKRLEKSCEIARAMVHHWSQLGDPKPWFYIGLFSTATYDEAKRFLAGHRLTSSCVPALAEDPDVKSWVESLCAETRELHHRLRDGLDSVLEARSKSRR
jgi:hypothetical protein